MNDTKYEKTDFTITPLEEEYDFCTFVACSFVGVDLKKISFEDCIFEGCDFTMAKVVGVSFLNCTFKGCKLQGVNFEHANAFSFTPRFEGCLLNLSSFYKLSLKNLKFKECKLVEVDFARSDLSGAVFEECDLSGATFDNTNLEKADFRTSQGYSIDPERNRIKKARFSLSAVGGLLDKYDIKID